MEPSDNAARISPTLPWPYTARHQKSKRGRFRRTVLLRVRLTLADPTDELAADLPILGGAGLCGPSVPLPTPH